MPAFPSLLSRLRPHASAAFSLGGLFFNRSISNSTSNAGGSFLLRPPSPSAPREVPTPLVFVSAKDWDTESVRGMDVWATYYSERGYTCMQIDLAKPNAGTTDASNSEALMSHFENQLLTQIRLSTIPFPPVLIARSAGSIIAQTYISSHPAKALILHSPPSANASVPTALLPTPLKEFDYEPKFPILVMGDKSEADRWRQESRLGKDPGVDVIEVGSGDNEFLRKMEQWMDEVGI